MPLAIKKKNGFSSAASRLLQILGMLKQMSLETKEALNEAQQQEAKAEEEQSRWERGGFGAWFGLVGSLVVWSLEIFLGIFV